MRKLAVILLILAIYSCQSKKEINIDDNPEIKFLKSKVDDQLNNLVILKHTLYSFEEIDYRNTLEYQHQSENLIKAIQTNKSFEEIDSIHSKYMEKGKKFSNQYFHYEWSKKTLDENKFELIRNIYMNEDFIIEQVLSKYYKDRFSFSRVQAIVSPAKNQITGQSEYRIYLCAKEPKCEDMVIIGDVDTITYDISNIQDTLKFDPRTSAFIYTNKNNRTAGNRINGVYRKQSNSGSIKSYPFSFSK